MRSYIHLRKATEPPITAAGTVTGPWASLEEGAQTYTVIVRVTNPATDAEDTLDVYIDADYGGGAINAIHFPQVLGNGGTKVFLFPLRGDGTAIIDATSDAAVNVGRLPGVPWRLRYRAVAAEGGLGGPLSFPLAVYAYAA
jgi:hypothetical protein